MGLAGAVLLFTLPALLFLEQNYEIFVRLAYDIQPGLVKHLEREVLWMRVFLGGGALATVGIGLFFVRRLARSFLDPIERVDRHLNALTHGRWREPTPQTPGEDAFRELFLTYDYFHRSLVANAEKDLRLLEKLNIDPSNREAHAAWNTLLASLRHRLEEQPSTINDPGATSVAAGFSRRAS